MSVAPTEELAAVGSSDTRPADAEDVNLTCPSGPAEPGSVLLGVVAGRGQVAYLSPNIPVTKRLLQSLADETVPIENRMRFASACIEKRCIQWKGASQAGRCGLIDHAVAALQVVAGPQELPHCGIRATCRWFAQHRQVACGVCPQVIRRPVGQCRDPAG